jgi:CBS domain-containing protein
VGQIALWDILHFYLSDHPQAKNFSGPVQPILEVLEKHQGDTHSFTGTLHIPEKSSRVMTIVSLFEPFSRGIHSVLIELDFPKKTYKSISPFELLKFIIKNPSLLHHSIKYQTLENLECVTTPVITATPTMKVLDAYALINKSQVGALAIVNHSESKELMGTLSVSDFPPSNDNDLDMIKELTIEQFICRRHGNIRTPITALKNETFWVVLHRLIDSNIHRLWIVDQENHLYGLITLTDIYRVMVKSITQVGGLNKTI